DLLCADRALPDQDRQPLREFFDLLSVAVHLEYSRRRLELKRTYLPFDPDSDAAALAELPAEERQRRLNGLLRECAWLLDQARFKHLSREEIEPVLGNASDWGICMDGDFSAFEHLAFFVRGEAHQTRKRRLWRNLWREEEVEVPIYRRLVLMLKLRPHPRLGPGADTQHVFVK